MGLNLSFFRFVKNLMRDSLKMSYTEHLLSSSISLKNKEVLIIHVGGGGEFERSGSIFGKHYGSRLFSPLNMAHFCVFSYNWVICLSLSHTDPMSHNTPLDHPKSAPIIVALCFGLSC
jgi:hypothetical protein